MYEEAFFGVNQKTLNFEHNRECQQAKKIPLCFA